MKSVYISVKILVLLLFVHVHRRDNSIAHGLAELAQMSIIFIPNFWLDDIYSTVIHLVIKDDKKEEKI